MIDHSKPPCEECRSYDDERHGLECSKSTLTLEEKVEAWKTALANERKHNLEMQHRSIKTMQRFHERVVFWQGKYRIVKEENNALRKKVSKQEKVKASAG